MKIITYGTFDLFHIGHLNILRRAKALGAHLSVGISTDEFNLEAKDKICAQPFAERAEIVGCIKYVDEVFAERNWQQKVKDITNNEVDIFVIGDDWRGKFDYLKAYCEVVYLSRTEGVSTSERKFQIIKRFSNQI